jgi:hypothetical protein
MRLRSLALVSVCLAVSLPARAADDPHAAIRQRIRDMVTGVRDVPLPIVIEALSGRSVVPWDGEQREALERAAAAVLKEINRGGITSGRINEAGNVAEKHVLAALRAEGFSTDRPVAPSGRVRTAGYPDLLATLGDDHFYVEVKIFSASTEDSTQRSFYLSPSADFKVTRDAHHLLIAIELVPVAKGLYRTKTVRWLDLSRLHCDLKYEFNASNRDMYRPEAGLVVIESKLP